jgi:DNA modification methylase
MSDAYREFIAAKAPPAEETGFDIPAEAINPAMKPHAAAITRWGVRGGRRAYFTAFGLGKTTIQLETGRLVLDAAARAHGMDRRGLIVLPLGVRQEFKRDAVQVLGWEEEPRFIRSTDEAGEGISLTNYESVRDGKVDPAAFTWASLDEASCLRSFGSKTFQTFLPLFDQVPYRHVATATPSPNRFKELIHYAGFLGIMDTGQALTRFFQRNSEKAGDLTLYPHKEREFWLWVNSWAIFLQKPSDLGYSDDGYVLPEITVRWHEVQADLTSTDTDRDGQIALFRNAAMGLQQAAKERRDTLPARIAKVAEIRQASPDDRFILWHDLEDERRALEQAIPGAVSVYGTQDLDEREQAIIDFSDGKITDLAAKPVIAGSGCNFQRHCHRAVFAGVGFKFNDFIQAIHRIQRFGQTRPVEIDIVYAETEREVRRDLEAKWARDKELRQIMTEIIRKYGLNHREMGAELARASGVERIEASGDGWLVANNDCVEETRRMEENSVDLIVTSIPFSNHYEYSPNYNDFGHTDDNAHFWAQMDFLTPELFRVLAPGRIAAIHVKDRILFGSVTGHGRPAVSPFHAETIGHYQKHGFVFAGMITVVTDVVRENNQTYRLGYTEMCKDGSRMGVGSPEYVCLFFKPQTDRSKGYADKRIARSKADYSLARWQVDAHAFWRSSGNRAMTAEELAALPPDKLVRAFTAASLADVYDYETHVRIGEALEVRGALPSTFMALAPGSHDPDVWHDVARMLTLNGEQTRRGLENHICPLQFDIVDRCIERWSMKGETVYDPFGGLFTVPNRAIRLGRKGRAAELNTSYFLDGVKHLQAAERELAIPSLFDLLANDDEPSAEAA